MRSLRKFLHKTGTLNIALSLKRKWRPAEESFRPCTPNLLIAVSASLKYLYESQMPVAGDYLEFGIFRGFTLWYVQAIADLYGFKDMRFFGFDSFFGLPTITDSRDVSEEFHEGDYECTRSKVEGYLSQYRIDWSRTYLVEGFFSKSLTPQLRRDKRMSGFRLCVIDADLYQSAKEALEFVGPLIKEGSIILFDDWNSFHASDKRGERAAFHEFLKSNPMWKAEPFIEFGNHGAGFTFHYR